jgi:hypothetical protein
LEHVVQEEIPVNDLPIQVSEVEGGKPLNDGEHGVVCALIAGCTLKEAFFSVGVAPRSHYRSMSSNPYYKALVDHAWEVVHDTLFSLVIERAKEGDNRLLLEALKYVGNHLGKSTSRLELTGADGGTLMVQADYNEQRVISMTQELRHTFEKNNDEEAAGWS